MLVSLFTILREGGNIRPDSGPRLIGAAIAVYRVRSWKIEEIPSSPWLVELCLVLLLVAQAPGCSSMGVLTATACILHRALQLSALMCLCRWNLALVTQVCIYLASSVRLSRIKRQTHMCDRKGDHRNYLMVMWKHTLSMAWCLAVVL